METVTSSLIRFANCRDKAYRSTNTMNALRAAAITKIKRVADFYSKKSHDMQLRLVLQLETELLTILPEEGSRYGRLRSKVLGLLERAKREN